MDGGGSALHSLHEGTGGGFCSSLPQRRKKATGSTLHFLNEGVDDGGSALHFLDGGKSEMKEWTMEAPLFTFSMGQAQPSMMKRKEHYRRQPGDLGPDSGKNRRRQIARKMKRERARTMKIEVERTYKIDTMYITQLRAHSRH